MEGTSMHVMHFQNAVRAHNDWWLQFEKYLQSEADEHTFDDVKCDDRCAIGKWLHGEGQKFSHFAEFQEVLNYHADLHEAAGRAREAKLKGLNDELKASIEQLSRFRHLLFMNWSALNDKVGALD